MQNVFEPSPSLNSDDVLLAAAAAGAGKSKQIQNREIKILPVW